MRFGKLETVNLKEKLDKMLREFAEENNLTYNSGNVRYGDDISTKVSFIRKSSVSVAGSEISETKESLDFKNNAFRHGIPVSLLFREFSYNNRNITLKGYKTRSSKYPVMYTDGVKNYKCSIDYFLEMARSGASESFI